MRSESVLQSGGAETSTVGDNEEITSIFVLVLTLRYLCVVATLEWPRGSLIAMMLAPASSRCIAFDARSMWG